MDPSHDFIYTPSTSTPLDQQSHALTTTTPSCYDQIVPFDYQAMYTAPSSSSSSNMHNPTIDTQQQQQQSSSPSVATPTSTKPKEQEAPPRKRTRATPEQLAVLEKTFSVNPSPNNKVREQLSRELGMSERSIQIWFQNRRAKVKNMAKRSSLLHDETVRMQYYAATAAAAACQAAAYHYQHMSPDGVSLASNPDLYYYYYYYYYNQQQQQRRHHNWFYANGNSRSSSVPPPPLSLHSLPPPPPPPPPPPSSFSSVTPPPSSASSETTSATTRTRAHSLGPYPQQLTTRRGSPYYDSSCSADNMTNNVPAAAPAPGPCYRTRSYTLPAGPHPFSSAVAQQTIHPMPTDGRLETPMSVEEDNSSALNRIPAETLQIGTWKRMTLGANDLSCYHDTVRRMMVWCIQDGHQQQQFKIEFSIDSLLSVRLEPLLERLGWARLAFCIAQPEMLAFYMMHNGHWTQCHDFTQDRQATTVNVHQLEGPALPLRAELYRMAQNDQHIKALLQEHVQAIDPRCLTVQDGDSMMSLLEEGDARSKQDNLLLFQSIEHQG